MEKMIIQGPCTLNGTVQMSCAKNAYLPIMAGVLLCEEPVILKDVPPLRDLRTMERLLQNLGCLIDDHPEGTLFDASRIIHCEANYNLVKTMRASICVLGPLLGRLGKAKVSLPGGCAIGTRPIDIHLKNLEKLGAKLTIEHGYVKASAKNGLRGAHLILDFPSVGATENILMAATKAKGETIIENAALEPEVSDLANFLNTVGARIEGIGSKILKIQGVQKMGGGSYRAIGDRIEAGTFIMATLMTGGNVNVTGFVSHHLKFVLETLKSMNAHLEIGDDFVHVFPSQLAGSKVETAPWPGLPTDIQAQMIALATQAEGTSVIIENIFENRFMHVPELNRLGADISLSGKQAVINGKKALKGAPVMCTDLRASAALVMAALVSTGITEVQRIYHLDRGYSRFEQKLASLGADIRRDGAQ